MSQASVVIANAAGAAVRANLNAALGALVSANSGSSAPSPTYPGMEWLDTSVSPAVHKRRNAANTAWLTLLPETQAAETFWGNSALSAAAAGEIGVAAALTMLGISFDAVNKVCELPGGLMLQWDIKVNVSASGSAITFPVAYSGTPVVVTGVNSGSPRFAHYDSLSGSGFTIYTANAAGVAGSYTAHWFAIGD